MSYDFYKVLHFTGLFLLFSAFGAQLLNALQGGGRQWTGKRFAGIVHGLGLLLVFVAGFGLIARLQIPTPWPLWIWGKITVWLLLGASLALINRRPAWARGLWLVIVALGAFAAWMARTKPF